MRRMISLFAVLALAAIVTVVPAANAQVKVHYLGAGSSAMFQGFEVAAVNDLATTVVTACPAGDTCSVSHWSVKTGASGAIPANSAAAHDSRNAAILDEPGNLWIVWNTCTVAGGGPCAGAGANGATDVWAYLSVDSTVGVREFLGGSALTINAADVGQLGVNAVSPSLFVAPFNVNDVALANDVFTALTTAPTNAITAGMTDIRPEDALFATMRILGTCPVATGCGNPLNPANGFAFSTMPAACPTVADTDIPGATACAAAGFWTYIYSFTLGYGNGADPRIGTAIVDFFNGSKANPVDFALPNFPDPFTNAIVSPTIKVFPVGESPILLLANRTNNTAGLGQVQSAAFHLPACTGNTAVGVPGFPGTTGDLVCVNDAANGGGAGGPGYTGDGSYYVRNMWDQHPYPSVNTAFPSLTYTSAAPAYGPPAGFGYCNNASADPGFCHITRRPLGNLFAGNLCEGRNTAFSWPLDSALEGLRTAIPNGFSQAAWPGNLGTDFAVNLILREPLSGTYNTFEYTEVRRFGTPLGNFSLNPGGTAWGKPPFISQEANVPGDTGAAPFNPLHNACTPGFGDVDAEGSRYRAVGTGEVVNNLKTPPAGAGTDFIGYAFFSFGNISAIATNQNFGYLMLDGVDPLFADYTNAAGNAGQPATPAAPLKWGELPVCAGCTASTIWSATPTYPHLRDGSYPSWSELRMMCDPGPAAGHCSVAQDPLGAQALVSALQVDIHCNNTGGVPDLLPFNSSGNANPCTAHPAFNPFPLTFGDVGFIRDHAANLVAGTVVNGLATVGAYGSFFQSDDTWEQNNGGFVANYVNAGDPQTTHQSNFNDTAAAVNDGPTVSFANWCGAGVNSPPNAECGGDVGGAIIAVGAAGANKCGGALPSACGQQQ